MTRRPALILQVLVVIALTGCGAEVAGTAATAGAARGAEVEALRQTPEHVREQVDAASRNARERLEAAEQAAGR